MYNAELIFGLDFNSLSRIQDLSEIVRRTKVDKIMIDHHESPEFFANLNYSDPNMSSTCEMVYNVIKVLYKCCTVCIYCVRIDSSGIAANAHRHLWACEADHKTNNNKSIHKNTSKSKQHQRRNR